MVSSGVGGGPLQEQSPAISPFVGPTQHYLCDHTTLLYQPHHTIISTTPHYYMNHATLLLWTASTLSAYNTRLCHTTHPEYFAAVLSTIGDHTTVLASTTGDHITLYAKYSPTILCPLTNH